MAKGKEDFYFEIYNHLGVISGGSSGWKKELTFVSWKGDEPKYDIRSWNKDYTKPGKGISLTEEELRQLKELIDQEIKCLDK